MTYTKGFFDPLPPCPHLELIYTTKFTQSSLLHLLFHDAPPPSDADIISGRSLTSIAMYAVTAELYPGNGKTPV